MNAALKRAQTGAAKKDAGWRGKVEELLEKILASGFDKVAQLARDTVPDADRVRRKSQSESNSDDESDDDDEGDGKKGEKKEKSLSGDSKTLMKEVKKRDEARVWVRFFYVMIEPVTPRVRLVEPFLDFAKQLFRYAVRARENGDYKDALYCLDEMAFPLGEAERLSKDAELHFAADAKNSNDKDGAVAATAAAAAAATAAAPSRSDNIEENKDEAENIAEYYPRLYEVKS